MIVVTFSTPAGECIHLTRPQIERLRAAGTWPRGRQGQEYCNVQHGEHSGTPTWTDAELADAFELPPTCAACGLPLTAPTRGSWSAL